MSYTYPEKLLTRRHRYCTVYTTFAGHCHTAHQTGPRSVLGFSSSSVLDVPFVDVLPLPPCFAIEAVGCLLRWRVVCRRVAVQQRRRGRLSTFVVDHQRPRQKSSLGRGARVLPRSQTNRLSTTSSPAKPTGPPHMVLTDGVRQNGREDNNAGRYAGNQSDVHPQRRRQSGLAVVEYNVVRSSARPLVGVEVDRGFPGRKLNGEQRDWGRPGCGGTRDEDWKVGPSNPTKIGRVYYGRLSTTRFSVVEERVLRSDVSGDEVLEQAGMWWNA